jgi:hypothetical protein
VASGSKGWGAIDKAGVVSDRGHGGLFLNAFLRVSSTATPRCKTQILLLPFTASMYTTVAMCGWTTWVQVLGLPIITVKPWINISISLCPIYFFL